VRAVVQRVRSARVTVEGEEVGAIGGGLLAYVGVAVDDGTPDAEWVARKVAELRLFAGEDARFDRSLADRVEAGEPAAALVVSQFTLLADIRKGRRPAFTQAATGEHAEPLVEAVADVLRSRGVEVAGGRFGVQMVVASDNDGPATLWLDSTIAVPRPGGS
jgi:D-aminoacyl-tRNA deacylase